MAFHSKPSRTLALAAALALLATPAYAQFSDGYNFLKAVKERKGEETEKYINEPGSVIVNTRDSLLAAREEKLLGTFTRGHLPFSIDRDHNPAMAAAVPTLTEMAQAALTRFLAGDKPFLLQIEGARIDHAAHLNDIGALLGDQLAFDDALAAVLALIGRRDGGSRQPEHS